MPRVFLLQPSDKPLANAADFGEITIMISGRLNPIAVTETSELIANTLEQMAFDADVDHICMTGQTLSLALLAATVMDLYGTLPMLVYDARSGSYATRTLEGTTA